MFDKGFGEVISGTRSGLDRVLDLVLQTGLDRVLDLVLQKGSDQVLDLGKLWIQIEWNREKALLAGLYSSVRNGLMSPAIRATVGGGPTRVRPEPELKRLRLFW